MARRLRISALVFIIGIGIGLLALGPANADSRESAAIEAAEEWLALVDAGQFETSWERAASLFRSSVSAEKWAMSVSTVRRPFGELISRELLSANSMTSLPGAPDGQYVVIRYRAKFEKKRAAIETVTPMLDDGDWKVSGYYVK